MADEKMKAPHPKCPEEICGRHQGRGDCTLCESLEERDRFVRMCLGGFLPVVLRGLWWLLKRAAPVVWWLFWDFSGLRFIWQMIVPPDPSQPPRRPPATFFLWFVGLYFALFGITSQRYENRLDRIEIRANTIYAQLGTPIATKALERIPDVQGLTGG